MNRVIAGDYKGKGVTHTVRGVCIVTSVFNPIVIEKSNVDNHELVTEEHAKSAASGIGRGLVGGALLGPVGLLGGALSAKSKGTYRVALQFKDGKKSLLEIDKKIYNKLMEELF